MRLGAPSGRTMDSTTTAPTMTSRSVQLRPPTNRFIDSIFQLACTADVPWAWRGHRETAEGFRESLYNDLLAMFAIRDRRNDQEIGLVCAQEFQALHRFAYMSTLLMPAYQGRVWPLEGTVLFANYLFTRFDLRHLYGRVIEADFAALSSGVGRF